MSIIKYSILFKDLKSHNKVKRLEIIKSIIEVMLFLAIFLFMCRFMYAMVPVLGERGENATIHRAWAYVLFLTNIIYFAYNFYFIETIKKLRKNQTLNKDSEIETAIISHDKRVNFDKLYMRKMLLLSTGAVLVVFMLSIMITGRVLFYLDLRESLAAAVINTILSYGVMLPQLFAIFSLDVLRFSSIPKKDDSKQIDFLTVYFHKKNGLTDEEVDVKMYGSVVVENDKKIRSEIYPAKKTKRNLIIILLIIIPPFLAGAMGSVVFLGLYLLKGKAEHFHFALIIFVAIFILSFIALPIIKLIDRNKLKSFFEADKDKYSYHLELHYEKQKHFKLCCLIFLASFTVAAVIGTSIFWAAGTTFVGALAYGLGIGLGAIVAAMNIIKFTLTRKHHKKASVIAAKIKKAAEYEVRLQQQIKQEESSDALQE